MSLSQEGTTNLAIMKAIVPLNFRIDCVVGRDATRTLAVDYPV